MTSPKATSKLTATHSPAKTHAQHFCDSLSASQRNALRTIMYRDGACAQLKHALGLHKVHVVTEHARRTGKAMQGRTIDLFTHHAAQNILER